MKRKLDETKAVLGAVVQQVTEVAESAREDSNSAQLAERLEDAVAPAQVESARGRFGPTTYYTTDAPGIRYLLNLINATPEMRRIEVRSPSGQMYTKEMGHLLFNRGDTLTVHFPGSFDDGPETPLEPGLWQWTWCRTPRLPIQFGDVGRVRGGFHVRASDSAEGS